MSHDGTNPVDHEQEVERLQAEVAHARHALLVHRDHVVGLEAQNGRLQRDLSIVVLELKKSQRRVKALAKRRDEQAARVKDTQERLERNRRRVVELEAVPPARASLPRRVARRVRGAIR